MDEAADATVRMAAEMLEHSRPGETTAARHGAASDSGLNIAAVARTGRRGDRRMAPGARWCGALLLMAALGACAAVERHRASEEEINIYPANYKADILGAMHAYLNDPTGIRDGAVSEPALKSLPSSEPVLKTTTRYVACVRFNGKKSSGEYAGLKENVAIFLYGRLDQFVAAAKDQCTGVTYQPFPELGKLSR
jgi:hypothetical protein